MKRRHVFSLAVISLSAVLTFVLFCSQEGVSVHIRNNTESELKDIVLEFAGGKKIISRLSPGEKIIRTVSPVKESSLTVNYNTEKNAYKKKLDVYIEPAYKGHLFITIGDNGKIIYKSEVGL